jgi:hypothetical protein
MREHDQLVLGILALQVLGFLIGAAVIAHVMDKLERVSRHIDVLECEKSHRGHDRSPEPQPPAAEAVHDHDDSYMNDDESTMLYMAPPKRAMDDDSDTDAE